MEYTVEYFIKKFEAILEDDWGFGTMGEKKCAYGLCGAHPLLKEQPLEAIALSKLFKKHLGSEGNYYVELDWIVVSVNDGHSGFGNPKRRVLTKLYEIRDKELSEANVIEASKIINEEILVF